MLLQLLLQSDSAYACVRELGELVSALGFDVIYVWKCLSV